MSALEYGKASALFDEALALFRCDCPEATWEVATTRAALLTCLFLQARFREWHNLSERWLAEAGARGDVMARCTLLVMGSGYALNLQRDDPEAATRDLKAGEQKWSRPGVLGLMSLTGSHARHLIGMYRGGASPVVAEEASRNGPLTMPPLASKGGRVAYAYADAALLAASTGSLEVQRLRSVHTRLRKRRAAMSADTVPALQLAQLEYLLGDTDTAAATLEEAARSARAASFGVASLACAYLAAHLVRDEQTKCQLLEDLRTQGWHKPKRALRMFLPIVDSLE